MKRNFTKKTASELIVIIGLLFIVIFALAVSVSRVFLRLCGGSSRLVMSGGITLYNILVCGHKGCIVIHWIVVKLEALKQTCGTRYYFLKNNRKFFFNFALNSLRNVSSSCLLAINALMSSCGIK